MMASHAILAFPLGGWELAVIVLVAGVLLFGKRLPELGRSLGQSITEFKRGLASGHDDKPPKPPEQLADKREQDS